MKMLFDKMLELPFAEIDSSQLYELEYGVAFILENGIKYID